MAFHLYVLRVSQAGERSPYKRWARIKQGRMRSRAARSINKGKGRPIMVWIQDTVPRQTKSPDGPRKRRAGWCVAARHAEILAKGMHMKGR